MGTPTYEEIMFNLRNIFGQLSGPQYLAVSGSENFVDYIDRLTTAAKTRNVVVSGKFHNTLVGVDGSPASRARAMGQLILAMHPVDTLAERFAEGDAMGRTDLPEYASKMTDHAIECVKHLGGEMAGRHISFMIESIYDDNKSNGARHVVALEYALQRLTGWVEAYSQAQKANNAQSVSAEERKPPREINSRHSAPL